MRKFLITGVLALFFLGSNAQEKAPALPPVEFRSKLDKGNVQVLDVRTADEFKSGHLTQALQADWNKRADFLQRIQSLDKDKPVYVYCLAGVRGEAAAKRLREEGFKDVVNMSGGIMAWKKAGLPLVVPEGKPGMTYKMLEEKIAGHSLVLVDIGASWCPPCKKMAPVIQQLVKATPGLQLIPVDASSDTEVVQTLQAEDIPVFILYKDGKAVWRRSGIVAYEALQKAVTQ